MGYAIGTVTKGSGADCHYQVLGIIKTLAEANGWVTQRSTSTEWIARSTGLSGTEEIFIGIKTYENINADFYNLLLGTFTGYVSGNSFETQPGADYRGVPAHNNAITYYITANAQRIVFILKVGTPVYTHGYIGKFYPYARPSEFPAPLVCAGCLSGAQETRFSDTNIVFPYHGKTVSDHNQFYMRRPDGSWYEPAMWPFTHGSVDGDSLASTVDYGCQVPTNGNYQVEAIILHDRTDSAGFNNVWGELDGVSFISGFNNASENVVQVGGNATVDQTDLSPLEAVNAIRGQGGRAFVMGQNINRTSWRDFVGIEMS